MNLQLPKIQTPTFRLTIPSSKEEVICRPFVTKEEKLLLLAKGGEMGEELQACKQIINNCVLQWNQKIKSVDELTICDLEYILLQLRIKSVSEVVDITFTGIEKSECKECSKPTQVSVDLKEVKLPEMPPLEEKIMLDDTYGVILRHLSIGEQEEIANKLKANTPEIQTDISALVNAVFFELAHVVRAVYTADTVSKVSKEDIPQIQTWLEELPKSCFEKIQAFVEKMPKLTHDIKLVCKTCGKEQSYHFEGLSSFFD